MAEQLNNTNSEIVYVDFSRSSMLLSQLKVHITKTSSVVWITEWIENISRLGIGKFDYVTCTGLLHHLKSPFKGLNIIKDAQMEYGGAALMVYAKYGRTGIYQIQTILRIIDKKENRVSNEITNAKQILKILPIKHWFYNGGANDHLTMGDVGIYDLFLHRRDTAYSVLDLYQWIERSNYYIVAFSQAGSRVSLSLKLHIAHKTLYDRLVKVHITHIQWIAEMICGNIMKQEVYISRRVNAEASLNAHDNKIFAYGSPYGFRDVVNDKINYKILRNKTYIYSKLKLSFIDKNKNTHGKFRSYNGQLITEFAFPLTEFSVFIITALTKKPMKPYTSYELISTFKRQSHLNSTIKELKAMFSNLFWYLKDTGLFLLKHEDVGLFPKTCCYNKYYVRGIHSYD